MLTLFFGWLSGANFICAMYYACVASDLYGAVPTAITSVLCGVCGYKAIQC